MNIAILTLLSTIMLSNIVNWQTIEVIWEPVTKNIYGGPTTIIGAEIGFFPLDGKTSRGWRIPNSFNGTPIFIYQAQLPPNTYHIRVRVYNESGLSSEWSDECKDKDGNIVVFEVPNVLNVKPEKPNNVIIIIK